MSLKDAFTNGYNAARTKLAATTAAAGITAATLTAAPQEAKGAVIYDVDLSGTVINVDVGAQGQGIKVGDAVDIEYQIDSSAPDLNSSPSFGAFQDAVGSGTLTIGPYTATHDNGDAFTGDTAADFLSIGIFESDQISNFPDLGTLDVTTLYEYKAQGGGPLVSADLVHAVDQHDQFTGTFGRMRTSAGDIDFELTSVKVSIIPEPSTVALLSAGTGALLLRRRRRDDSAPETQKNEMTLEL